MRALAGHIADPRSLSVCLLCTQRQLSIPPEHHQRANELGISLRLETRAAVGLETLVESPPAQWPVAVARTVTRAGDPLHSSHLCKQLSCVECPGRSLTS